MDHQKAVYGLRWLAQTLEEPSIGPAAVGPAPPLAEGIRAGGTIIFLLRETPHGPQGVLALSAHRAAGHGRGGCSSFTLPLNPAFTLPLHISDENNASCVDDVVCCVLLYVQMHIFLAPDEDTDPPAARSSSSSSCSRRPLPDPPPDPDSGSGSSSG